MQKYITLLSSFQATVQDYNKSHDITAAREKGKNGKLCYLEKGAGYKQRALDSLPEILSTSSQRPGALRGLLASPHLAQPPAGWEMCHQI